MPIQSIRQKKEKRQAVIASVQARGQRGQPVLVGTHTVAEPECLSELLNAVGTPHQVLKGRQDEQQADIAAKARESSRITLGRPE